MTTVHPAVERAGALINLTRYDDAESLLRQHLTEHPDDIDAWIDLSLCHTRAKQPEKGLDAADKALTLNPENVYALRMRAHALREIGSRWQEAEEPLREVIRLAPDDWHGYAYLADLIYRIRITEHVADQAFRPAELPRYLFEESAALAREAIRLGPEEVYAYEVAFLIDYIGGDGAVAEQMNRAILQLDPTHPDALARQTKFQASAPGVKAAQAATLYADALASAPNSEPMQEGLDHASYRLLRGIRWLALLCLAFAAVQVDLLVTEDEVPRELPVPLGQRLWFLVPTAAIWTVGALLRYRRLRAGVRVNLHSVIRRRRWPRIVLAQATWAMICTLLITQPAWTERQVPQLLVWAGLLPTLATIWFDRRKTR
ncbi:tetratricopeptide repeat protein [Streptomyces sp. MZ04]|uniref:tetratricopeptide repeat protein n=1 Tax=Streptomyces sp. MZ04 TaxID=2559236 RepID=UPI00107EDDA3|nr:tetratricopeptide repeat protein [Streptomyces sp. MZ04]TGB05611.1 tetratricopeptide repeat protein [Streptomyces sp. MZ04]